MNKLTLIFSLALGANLTCLSLFAPISFAQSTNTDGFDYTPNEYNPVNDNRSFNPIDLIHRANLSNGVSQEEFYQNSGTNLQDAATQFKLQRQQQLNQQKTNPTTDSSSVNQ